MNISKFLAPLLLLLVFVHTPAIAQTNSAQSSVEAQQKPAPPKVPLQDPSAWTRILDTTEQAISRDGVTDADLNRLLNETDKIRVEAAARAQTLQAQVDQARQQLTKLGAAPAEGEPPEAPEVRDQREQLNKNFAEVDALLKSARVSEVRAQQLKKSISDILNQRFVSSISARSKGLTTADFWTRFASGFSGFGRSVYLLLTDSFSVFLEKITTDARSQFLLLFGVGALLLLFIRARRLLKQLGEYTNGVFGLARAGVMPSGLLRYLATGVLPGLLIYSLYALLSGLELLTPRLDQFLFAVTAAAGFAIAAMQLFRVYLSPADSTQRIFALKDDAASRIFSLISVALSVAVLLVALKQIAKIVVAPIQVSIGLSLASALLVGIVGIIIQLIVRKDRQLSDNTGDISATMPRTIKYLSWLLWPIVVVIVLASLTGYIAFAEFLSEQLLFGLFVVLSVWLILHFIDYVLLHLPAIAATDPQDPELSGEITSMGQAKILAAGVLKLASYVLAAILLLLPWGYRTSDIFEFVNDAFFGFEVGGLSISLSTIILAVLLFLIGYAVTSGLRNWLNNKFLPTTNLDIGISNSITTVFGYAGIIFAAILAITAAGFDLSNLAIVAGALSVGVGFGLQSIVNNFVSGLILLAERPIKAGDWVVTSGGEGFVRKISVRSTEIETFDRATVIVPNSTLITDNVTNWTHGNKSGRIIVKVGVGYDSDPEQITEILLECAKNHKLILGRPAPAVYFMDFGASSLDFELRCFLGDINYALSVKSELRFEILKALRAADIEIPYPQQDLHIRTNEAQLSEG